MDTLKLIELCHEQSHEAEHDFEDTVFVALTRRDIWLTCLAFLILRHGAECLEEEIEDILTRIGEVAEIQKDNWRAE